MSIQSICDQFTLTLKRQISARDSVGGVTYSYSTSPREIEGLPTEIRADCQTMTSEERAEYGITEAEVTWAAYTATDPRLTTKDFATWTDNSSVTRNCEVRSPSFDMAGRKKIWKTILIEKRQRT